MSAVAPPWTGLAGNWAVHIRSLGVFAVIRGGEAVPAGAWQSKKARDVVKILVTRRGRPITREALIETLWPEQDPQRTSNRLSVALGTARWVLDPERRFPPDTFIRADRYSARLDLDHVSVDVERFLALAGEGIACYRSGRLDEAAAVLERAEAAYTGEFLEEDIYDDWAEPLREESQALYDVVACALAVLAPPPAAPRGERYQRRSVSPTITARGNQRGGSGRRRRMASAR
jgi:DNA-binding SARP family transcriptional activator